MLGYNFSFCGIAGYIHSYRGSSFIFRETTAHLTKKSVVFSKITPYHQTRNTQLGRYKEIIWKSIQPALETNQLHESEWQIVLPQTLHSVKSLLSTATNVTLHDSFFKLQDLVKEPPFQRGYFVRGLYFFVAS